MLAWPRDKTSKPASRRASRSPAGRLVAAALALAGTGAAGQEAGSEHVVHAPLLSEAPALDGRMDEPVWEQAALLDGFTQLEPAEGAPVSERTEVRIGYDTRGLYVGVRCYDSQPEKIVAVVMDRDADLANDDSVQIVFDTFHDRANAYLFEVNAIGAQRDALIRNEGDEVLYTWDGIWTSVTSRDAEGWTAEIAIPFRTLRFPKDAEQTWGLNVQRSILRKREYALWKPIPRYPVIKTIFKVSQAGELTGLRDLHQGRSFDLKPYLLGRVRDGAAEKDDAIEVGLDVRKNLTSNLVLDLTYNLDFAEAEVDEQQVNLTRFKLFFPERRDFFLESADLFYFGEREDFLRKPQRIFFFSRQIGLSEDGDREIPVLGGAKVAGRLGRLGIGALNLTTEETTYRGRDGARRFEPETNYTAVRLRRDVLEKSTIGLMALNKAVSGGDDNRGAGVDWNFAPGKHFKTGGFLAWTSTPGLDGREWAGLVDVLFERKRTFFKGSYAETGENFNPEMGFFPRVGIRETRANLVHELIPGRWNLRNIYLFGDFFEIRDLSGDLETRVNRLETNIFWNRQAALALKVFEDTEVLREPFEISPGVIIPPGEYRFVNYLAGFQTSPGKPIFHYNHFTFGELYDGHFLKALLGLDVRPMAGLTIRLTYEHNDVDLPAGDFEVDLATTRVIYSVSPRLSFRLFAQWHRDDNFDSNLRLKWIYKPGAAFYVVYDEFRDLAADAVEGTDSSARSLVAKMSFYF